MSTKTNEIKELAAKIREETAIIQLQVNVILKEDLLKRLSKIKRGAEAIVNLLEE